MKEYSMETPKTPETSTERLSKKVFEIIREVDAAVAVEIHHEAHGMGEEVTDEEKTVAEREYFARYREQLLDVLDGSSATEKVLAVYDSYSKNEKGVEDTQKEITQIILESAEHTSEVADFEKTTNEKFAATATELANFLEKMIMTNAGNTPVRSKWGNAKLDYEKGDSARLVATLEEELKGVESDEDEAELKDYIEFLQYQRFGT